MHGTGRIDTLPVSKAKDRSRCMITAGTSPQLTAVKATRVDTSVMHSPFALHSADEVRVADGFKPRSIPDASCNIGLYGAVRGNVWLCDSTHRQAGPPPQKDGHPHPAGNQIRRGRLLRTGGRSGLMTAPIPAALNHPGSTPAAKPPSRRPDSRSSYPRFPSEKS